MLKLVVSSVRHNIGRYLATLIAILTGVGFYTAVNLISNSVIDALEGNVDARYGNVDVAIDPEDPDTVDGVAPDPAQLRVTQDAVDALLDLPGVEGGAGILTAPVAFLGENGKAFATDTTGRLWVTDEELNPLQVARGRAPANTGEVAVDKGLAADEGLGVGDEVTVLTLGGQQAATVVGITEFGDSDAQDNGGTLSVAEEDAFDWLGSGQPEYQAYYLRGSGDPADLVAEAESQAPEGFQVQTGEEFRDAQRDATGGFASTLKTALQAFAVLALLVGGFVIYNTFSVIVAQRLRELAVLAAIGATPRQLKRSLRLEGLVVGLIGSLLGVAAGFLLTLALRGILALTGSKLAVGVSLSVGDVVVGVLLGTVITVLSVLVPASRAGRAEPMAAMRDAATESATIGRTRGIVCGVLAVLGLAGMLLGSSLPLLGAGVVAFMVALFVGAPFIAKAGAQVARPLLRRLGMEGRLAVDNSVRNPKRTATTANALVIGVFLVTLVAVAGSSVKDFAVSEVQDLQAADYLVSSQGGSVDRDFVEQMRGIDGVSQVVPFQREPVTIDGEATVISAADVAELSEVAHVNASEGDFADLQPGTIALLDAPDGDVPDLGSRVEVRDARGRTARLEVAALLEPTPGAGQVGNLLAPETFESLSGDVAPTAAFVDVASGAQSETKDAIDALADLRPDITVEEGNAAGNLVSSIFDFVIRAVTGLLLMSVLIALIGIVNTMSLSILERRRELGLLRIIGMTDARVRRMVTLESVLIAVLGTLTGLVSGLVVALALILSLNRLSSTNIAPAVPWLELVLILVLGVLLGVLAALVPARRSTKAPVLDAISAT